MYGEGAMMGAEIRKMYEESGELVKHIGKTAGKLIGACDSEPSKRSAL